MTYATSHRDLKGLGEPRRCQAEADRSPSSQGAPAGSRQKREPSRSMVEISGLLLVRTSPRRSELMSFVHKSQLYLDQTWSEGDGKQVVREVDGQVKLLGTDLHLPNHIQVQGSYGCFYKLGIHVLSVLVIRALLFGICIRALILKPSHMGITTNTSFFLFWS